jgi:hypothetical protein
MDVARDARLASASEGATTMTEEATILRRCCGSARFGIEPHEARPEDFPTQPSQKDGMGRMCKTHWNRYTSALRKATLARQAADRGLVIETAPTEPEPDATLEPIRARVPRGREQTAAEAGSKGDAG